MKSTPRTIHCARFLTLAVALLAFVGAAQSTSAQVSPQDAQTLISAQQALESDNAQQAASLAQQFVANNPGEPDGHRILAAAQYQLGNLDAARESAVKAITLGRMTEDMLTRIMRIDMQQGRHASVAATASLLSMLEPDNLTWQLVRAQALVESKQYDAASQAFEAIVDAQPTDAATWAHLGGAALKLGDLDAAAAHYETAYHLGHADPALPVTLVRIYLSANDATGALDWHVRAAQLGADIQPQVTLALAQALVRAKQYSDARPLLEKLLSQVETAQQDDEAADIASSTHTLLATIDADQGDIAAAAAHLESAAKLGPFDATPLRFIANYYLSQNDRDQAAGWLVKAVDAGATDAQTLAQLIRLQLAIGRADDARANLTQYLERYSLDEQAAELIATLAGIS